MTESALGPISMPAARTSTDLVFDTLYDAVISLKLPPGTKVTEIEVAKHLDVSRQPVRDAFFRLSKLGFLLMRPQRATVVTLISKRAVLDALFTRTALEVECLRSAMARLPGDAGPALRANLARQELALNDAQAEFHALDEAFHGSLCEIAGHAHVWQLIREQKAHMDRIRYLTLSKERRRHVLAEHRALVDAIEAGNADRAESLLRSHIGAIETVLIQAQADHPDLFEPE